MRRAGAVGAILLLGALRAVPAAAVAIDESAIQCIECHADEGEKYVGLIEEWRSSIHYANGVTCGQCHQMSDTDFDVLPDPGEGAHTKPDTVRTVAMCAQCHREWIDYYPLSAHFQKKRVSCVMCHGGGGNNHGIQRASLAIITEKRCAECHTYERAEQVKAAFAEVAEADARLDRAIEEITERGYHSTRLADLHDASHALEKRMPLELHTFQLRRIKAMTKSITDIEETVLGEEDRILAKLAAQAVRRKVGLFIFASCFVLSGLILAYRQTYVDEWRATHGPPSSKA